MLITNAAVYTLSNVISSVIQFLLLLSLTWILPPQGLGYISIYVAITSIMSVLICMGINGSVSRFYFVFNKCNFSNFIGSSIILIFILSCIMYSFVASIWSYICNFLSFPEVFLSLIIINSYLLALISVQLSFFQSAHMANYYGIIQISLSLLTAITSLVLIALLGNDWHCRIYGQIISAFIISSIALYYMIKNSQVSFKFKIDYAYKAILYGAPLTIHTLSGSLISYMDRFIIGHLLSMEILGIYTTAYQFSSIFSILIDGFNKAYSPWLFSKLNNSDSDMRKKIVIFNYIYFIFVFLSSILFGATFDYLAHYFLSQKYTEALTYVSYLAIAFSFTSMYYMVTLYIQYANKTYLQSLITGSIAFLNIGLTYILILHSGSFGAVYSQLICQFLLFTITWFFASKVYHMPWNLKWHRLD